MPPDSDAPMPLPDDSAIAATLDSAPPDPTPEAAPEPGPQAQQQEPSGERPRDESGRFTKLDEVEQQIDALEGDPNTTPQSLAELKKLRAELKGYRETYQPFERTFAKLAPTDAQAVLGFVDLLNSDPAAAAGWMRENADRLSPAQEKAMEAAAQAAGAPEAAPSNADDDFDPYDPAQIDKRIEERAKALLEAQLRERDKQAEERRFVEKVQQTARDLGYSPGTSDYEHLLVEAKYHQGDLHKAHAALESRRPAGGSSAAEATDGGAGALRRVTAPEGVAPSGRKEPQTFEDADASAKARLAAMGFGK